MDDRPRVPCPDCGELIVSGAKVCRFCGLGRERAATRAYVQNFATRQQCLALFLLLVVAGACFPFMWARNAVPARPGPAPSGALNAEQQWLENSRKKEEDIKARMRQESGG
jgi:hypothetical protein